MNSLFELVMSWVVTIDPGSVVVGMLMAHAAIMAVDSWRSRRPRPVAYAWNRPEVLPPVDCPLVLRLGSVAVRAERVSYLRDRAGEMDYRLSDGSVITGRFEWSYP